MSCRFSGFKEHFARGQHFNYSLDDIGRYYCDYVDVMADFDAMLLGPALEVYPAAPPLAPLD